MLEKMKINQLINQEEEEAKNLWQSKILEQ